MTTRDQMVQIAAKEISHSESKQWLEESDLSAMEIAKMLGRANDIQSLFSAIGAFSPKEALTINPNILTAFSRYLSEIKQPQFSLTLTGPELNLLLERLNSSKRTADTYNTSSNALIVAIWGDKNERKHAATFPTRKFSHWSYPEACRKLDVMAKKYKQPL